MKDRPKPYNKRGEYKRKKGSPSGTFRFSGMVKYAKGGISTPQVKVDQKSFVMKVIQGISGRLRQNQLKEEVANAKTD